MTGSGLIVTVLRAAVKVKRLAEDGSDILEQSGKFSNDGKPILKPSVKVVNVKQGEPLPDHVADGELDRLKKLGVVGKPGEEAVATSQQAPKAAAGGGVVLDLEKLAEYDDGELAGLWAKKPPTVKDVLAAVGTSGDLAAKALAAENTATKNDGRATLVPALQKVIDEATPAS